ncbi:hypothetical protein SERLA73DRAFT_121741 [Serpula lacrymans var. lacrymans S7.3]|uniref:Uncharacterized protein n=1 Tax=Serpula lacrymans var. lacrymans (strain S7.3) TaxID=936435 RepID=F8PTY3_SERL3|nr:hypothetical protein SERLA73DRAFT_121741 [Serpula lacrymans var. lacrymans S7.3]
MYRRKESEGSLCLVSFSFLRLPKLDVVGRRCCIIPTQVSSHYRLTLELGTLRFGTRGRAFKWTEQHQVLYSQVATLA